jgi:LysM repeat protein
LHKFDELGHGVTRANDREVKPSKDTPLAIKPFNTAGANTVVVSATRSVLKKNNVKYVVAKKGDTYYRIAKEFEMGLWQLYRYNDFDQKKDVLEVGDIIYLQPKRGKSMSKDVRLVADGVKSLRQYSQEEGVKLDKLLKKNNVTNPELVLDKGKMIFLR